MGLTQAAFYLHVPFCRRKCPYCDFYSVPFADTRKIPEKAFLAALKKEVELHAEEVSSYQFVTFYVGGGTPSLLSAGFYEELFDFLAKRLNFEPFEATIEANPSSLNEEKLISYRKIFNRISIGAQSFKDKGLLALGRLHTVFQVKKAFLRARAAGFENISLDLIYGWPGQQKEDLVEELDILLSLGPEHVSCYELTLEPETRMYEWYQKGKLNMPSEEEIVSFYWLIHDFLTQQGFEHYEISNYARRDYECRHNLFYWEARPYLGLGPSAASFLDSRRIKNVEDLNLYLEPLEKGVLPPHEEEILDAEKRFREAVILGLRKLKGINVAEYERRFGFNVFSYYGESLSRLLDQGLLEYCQGYLRLSKRGILLANVVARELV